MPKTNADMTPIGKLTQTVVSGIKRATGTTPKPQKIDVGPMLIGTFHKTGTTLFGGILRQLANKHGVELWHSSRSPDRPATWDVCFNWHCEFKELGLNPQDYPTLVVLRDPRDVVISAAHYHMKSKETWLHRPREAFNGMTYQEKINSLPDMKARYLFEMDEVAGQTNDKMTARRTDPAYAGAKFVTLETLMTDVDLHAFTDIFTYLGFKDAALEKALESALNNSVFAGKRNQHMRDPRPAQWRGIFDDTLLAAFNDRFGDAAEVLGYPA